MKKTALSSLMVFALTLTLLAACGSGGSGGGGVTVSQPTTAVLTLSTAGTIPATTTINAYDVTVTLPAGVTVKSSVNAPLTDDGVVTATTGTASNITILGVYTAATGTFPGKVKISIINFDPITGAGFDPGPFCKVNGNIAAGHYPTASSFVQPTLDDATGTDLSNPSLPSTVVLTGELSLSATAVVK